MIDGSSDKSMLIMGVIIIKFPVLLTCEHHMWAYFIYFDSTQETTTIF